MIYKDLPEVTFELDPFAIVLLGGGAGIGVQAGYLTACSQVGIVGKAGIITGTSAGGLNAGLFSLFGSNQVVDGAPAYTRAVNIIEGITKNDDIYKRRLDFWGWAGAALGFATGSQGILDPTPLYNLLDRVFGKLTMEDLAEILNTHVMVSSANLNRKAMRYFKSYDPDSKNTLVSTALKCTSAIPGVFYSVPIKNNKIGSDEWYVDGGIGANNPFLTVMKYNQVFPGAPIKKIVIMYCYPDEITDGGLATISADTKSYKAYKDAVLGSVTSSLAIQEKNVEEVVEYMVDSYDWDVMAVSPKDYPCDALDFTQEKRLIQKHYDEFSTSFEGYDYKIKEMRNIGDFLRRKV